MCIPKLRTYCDCVVAIPHVNCADKRDETCISENVHDDTTYEGPTHIATTWRNVALTISIDDDTRALQGHILLRYCFIHCK